MRDHAWGASGAYHGGRGALQQLVDIAVHGELADSVRQRRVGRSVQMLRARGVGQVQRRVKADDDGGASVHSSAHAASYDEGNWLDLSVARDSGVRGARARHRTNRTDLL